MEPIIKVCGIVEYYQYMWSMFGNRVFRLTDTGYPWFFALGWCSYSRNEIVVCRVGQWQLRLLHELGHLVGYSHTMEHGHVMHPWGFRRGWSGRDDILSEVREKVSDNTLQKFGFEK